MRPRQESDASFLLLAGSLSCSETPQCGTRTPGSHPGLRPPHPPPLHLPRQVGLQAGGSHREKGQVPTPGSRSKPVCTHLPGQRAGRTRSDPAAALPRDPRGPFPTPLIGPHLVITGCFPPAPSRAASLPSGAPAQQPRLSLPLRMRLPGGSPVDWPTRAAAHEQRHRVRPRALLPRAGGHCLPPTLGSDPTIPLGLGKCAVVHTWALRPDGPGCLGPEATREVTLPAQRTCSRPCGGGRVHGRWPGERGQGPHAACPAAGGRGHEEVASGFTPQVSSGAHSLVRPMTQTEGPCRYLQE